MLAQAPQDRCDGSHEDAPFERSFAVDKVSESVFLGPCLPAPGRQLDRPRMEVAQRFPCAIIQYFPILSESCGPFAELNKFI